jgi:hypothetical protein
MKKFIFVLAAILMLPTIWDSQTILSDVTIIIGYGIYGYLVFSDRRETCILENMLLSDYDWFNLCNILFRRLDGIL